MSTCADCGKTIELKRGKWANRRDRGWDFTCRHIIVKSKTGNSILFSADYHHVAGEEQRHYQAPIEWPEKAFGAESWMLGGPGSGMGAGMGGTIDIGVPRLPREDTVTFKHPGTEEWGPEHGVTIILPPQPVTLVCPGCGLTRHLPDNWQEITGSTTMVCVACDRSMLPPEIVGSLPSLERPETPSTE